MPCCTGEDRLARRDRRYLGLSFASRHLPRWPSIATLIGMVGYVVLAGGRIAMV